MLIATITALILDKLLEASGLTEFLFLIISFTIIFAVLSLVFYLAGNFVVGSRRASLKDAFAISVLGTIILIVCFSVFSLDIAIILSIVAWLLLFRHYYETGFLGSIAVGLTSAIIAIIVLFILNSILGNSTLVFKWLPFFS
jgi:hypothetical protein